MRHAAVKTRPSRLGRLILRLTYETRHAMHEKPRPHVTFVKALPTPPPAEGESK